MDNCIRVTISEEVTINKELAEACLKIAETFANETGHIIIGYKPDREWKYEFT